MHSQHEHPELQPPANGPAMRPVPAYPKDYCAPRGRRRPVIPRGRQLAIMTILWTHGSLTAAQIQDELGELEEPEIARQTVLTYLSALRRYGWVRAQPARGCYVYCPALPAAWARKTAIDYVTDRLYGGAVDQLLSDVIQSRATPLAALARVRRALERRLATSAPAG